MHFSQRLMSKFVTSDRSRLCSSLLWWITDEGIIKSDQGMLELPKNYIGTKWKGISVFKDQLLLWNNEELFLYNNSSKVIQSLIRPYESDIDRAAWSDGTLIEFFCYQTQGHPTERSGYREQININTLKVLNSSIRQGMPPPWGSRGVIWNHKDVCSNQHGILYKHWIGPGYQFYWKKIGRGGKKKLPEVLNEYYFYRLLENNGDIFVCGFKKDKLILINIKTKAEVLKTELSSLINDAAFHNDKLYVAMHGREPVTIFNPNEK
jgi:hypothetical protein